MPNEPAPGDQRQQAEQRFDHCPWLFTTEATDGQRQAQHRLQERLASAGQSHLGDRCYIATSAAVFTDVLHLGDDSYIAAHAYVTGTLVAGANCSLNPFSTVRGSVSLGTGVRIGAHTSLLGFNHSTAPDSPIHRQPLTSRGITIGDDVWIGSHVVILDGVTIGDHCVIGAGAVVTRDLPTWTVAAGNPARPLRDRRDGPGPSRRAAEPPDLTGDLTGDLARFADRARRQAAGILARSWDGARFTDRPGEPPTVRAHCDAVEIADLLLGRPPQQLTAGEHVQRLSAAQDPATGLVPDIGQPPAPMESDGFTSDGSRLYHVLAVGYALDLLGSSFRHPVAGVRDMSAGQLVARLDNLPWQDDAWAAGAWVDSWATAAHWNRRRASDDPDHQEGPATAPGTVEALFGWLLSHADPRSGLWGHPGPGRDWLLPVNGYYRATRGSFAQFGLPVPYPRSVVDTVLHHAADARHFADGRENACNVLDVVHPLWLCTGRLRRHDGAAHREPEIRLWAERQLAAALGRWQDGEGFAFGATGGGNPGPGLQGTEMWLAIIWLLADLLGRSDALGYRPRGVHRPRTDHP